jgi:hypothetical protein
MRLPTFGPDAAELSDSRDESAGESGRFVIGRAARQQSLDELTFRDPARVD